MATFASSASFPKISAISFSKQFPPWQPHDFFGSFLQSQDFLGSFLHAHAFAGFGAGFDALGAGFLGAAFWAGLAGAFLAGAFWAGLAGAFLAAFFAGLAAGAFFGAVFLRLF